MMTTFNWTNSTVTIPIDNVEAIRHNSWEHIKEDLEFNGISEASINRYKNHWFDGREGSAFEKILISYLSAELISNLEYEGYAIDHNNLVAFYNEHLRVAADD